MGAFAEFSLSFVPDRDHTLPPSAARAVHALVFTLVSESDARVARRIHAQPHKPFTVSRILGPVRRMDGTLALEAGRTYGLRVTCYDDEGSRAIIETLSKKYAAGEAITLWKERFTVSTFALASINGYPPLLDSADIPDRVLDAFGAAPERIDLVFASPTAFKRQSDIYLFPEPRSVFVSLAQKLDVAGSTALLAAIDPETWDAVTVQRYDLKTATLRYGDIVLPGFRGTASFSLARLSEHERLVAASLAYAANYVGVGTKTTMGMGQCHMVLPAEGTGGSQ